MNFFRKMVASGTSDTVSHKRIASIVSLFMLIILSILSAFGRSSLVEFAYIFGALTGSESALTVVEKVSQNKYNNNEIG